MMLNARQPNTRLWAAVQLAFTVGLFLTTILVIEALVPLALEVLKSFSLVLQAGFASLSQPSWVY
jgi:hypothetical protein